MHPEDYLASVFLQPRAVWFWVSVIVGSLALTAVLGAGKRLRSDYGLGLLLLAGGLFLFGCDALRLGGVGKAWPSLASLYILALAWAFNAGPWAWFGLLPGLLGPKRALWLGLVPAPDKRFLAAVLWSLLYLALMAALFRPRKAERDGPLWQGAYIFAIWALGTVAAFSGLWMGLEGVGYAVVAALAMAALSTQLVGGPQHWRRRAVLVCSGLFVLAAFVKIPEAQGMFQGLGEALFFRGPFVLLWSAFAAALLILGVGASKTPSGPKKAASGHGQPLEQAWRLAPAALVLSLALLPAFQRLERLVKVERWERRVLLKVSSVELGGKRSARLRLAVEDQASAMPPEPIRGRTRRWQYLAQADADGYLALLRPLNDDEAERRPELSIGFKGPDGGLRMVQDPVTVSSGDWVEVDGDRRLLKKATALIVLLRSNGVPVLEAVLDGKGNSLPVLFRP